MQRSQTLQSISSVCSNTARCSQTPLELSKVLANSGRGSPGAPRSTCQYACAFRMLQDMTYKSVRDWSNWDPCTGLRGTSRVAKTTLQLGRPVDVVILPQRYFEFHNHMGFCLSYSSLLQLQDWQHHFMAWIIEASLNIYKWSIQLRVVLEHNRRSTWRHPLRELTDELEGHYIRNIDFTPPPPHPVSLAVGSRRGVYSDTWITEMHWATGSIYVWDTGVDRHYLTIHNTQTFFPSSWCYTLLLSYYRSTEFVGLLTHSYWALVDLHNLWGSSWPGSLLLVDICNLCGSSRVDSLAHPCMITKHSHQFCLDVVKG